jgi:hypothetical protein
MIVTTTGVLSFPFLSTAETLTASGSLPPGERGSMKNLWRPGTTSVDHSLPV